MSKVILSVLVSFVLTNSVAVFAGSALVTWQSPEDFTDAKTEYIDPNNEQLNLLFSRIEKHISRLAEMHLSEGSELQLTVKDYDMAGVLVSNTGMSGNSFERRVLPNEFPAMVIDFQWVDSEGRVLESGEDIRLEGRAIRTEGISRFPRVTRRDAYLTPEFNMLNRWFAEQFM
ncbi:MAG: protein of unknown function DUF3016 [Idiomarinaceae bacterium HL-53]|nr:MAG: protein of unknown function DUF3016 [Idiomarinaceae bacterium HL-53]CUS48217.1 Protein of unknown function (DUF3016) [Idiomarinaceae bacterium HL-53]